MSSERRAPPNGHAVLTTAIAAAWMGASTKYLCQDIEAGLLVANDLARNGERAKYRIYFDDFVTYLRRIHWSRIPKTPDDLFAAVGQRSSDAPSAVSP